MAAATHTAAPSAATPPATAAHAARIAALRLDALNLLIPQQDVRSLESSIDIDASAALAGAIGWIEFQKNRLPVYCLSQQLEPMAQAPAGRRVVVVLNAGTRAFGLLCSEVTLLEKLSGVVQEMPEAMILSGSPIYALAMHQGAVACVSSASRILAAVDPVAAPGGPS